MMIIVWTAVVILLVLDLTGIFRFTAKFGAAVVLLAAPHIVLVSGLLSAGQYYFLTAPVLTILIYSVLRLNILPIKLHKTSSHRLNFLFGGKRLLNLGIYTTIMQIPLYIFYYKFYSDLFNVKREIADAIVAFLLINIMIYNGMFRVIFASKWLNVLKRLLCWLFVWVPGINVFIMLYLRHTASKEYDYFEYKLNDMPRQVENKICGTRYPILLVHGVGFRDARYFNYWGRIPKQLRKRGAQIFYGNQEAWATIEYNSSLLYERVKQVLAETGAEKINIIAHSKGGLDCRYMISKYNLDCVASLTTMGTPHYGVKFADMLLGRLSDSFVDRIARIINKIFKSYGDTNPDFKNAVYSLTEKEAAEFNNCVKDSPCTYYQSYNSVMRCAFSDWILTIPYIIGRIAGSRLNDGLVPEKSAHWGNFRGTLRTKGMHGVSHGDMIDLKREDFKGFDIIQKYVDIVEELKNMGY